MALSRERALEVFHRVFTRDAEAHDRAAEDRQRLSLEANDDFVYGEIAFPAFASLLASVSPQPGERFCDLGSGVGKAVVAAYLLHDFALCTGVELLPSLHALAGGTPELLRGIHETQTLPDPRERLRFVRGDMLDFDLADQGVVYCGATCLGAATMARLLARLERLPPGARLILAGDEIHSPAFRLLTKSLHAMAWGGSVISTYERVESRPHAEP